MTDQKIIRQIEYALDQIRPNIQMDGGDIVFVKYEDGIVYIKMTGACVGCPASMYTLKMGIEETIKEHVPDVLEVIALQD
jgi:NFU1 iron-sulfur cluster scaffold homolog, mitochondrial